MFTLFFRVRGRFLVADPGPESLQPGCCGCWDLALTPLRSGEGGAAFWGVVGAAAWYNDVLPVGRREAVDAAAEELLCWLLLAADGDVCGIESDRRTLPLRA
jgi:hypothetical protein